jgi:hypothetical protein
MGKRYFCCWAAAVGPSTEAIMEILLASHKVEQQSYRTCSSLMKLSDRYSVTRIEERMQTSFTVYTNPGSEKHSDDS